jgi:hypothetical protein
MVLITFHGECVEADRLGAADLLAAALWERASWWVYAGSEEIGLRKTEKSWAVRNAAQNKLPGSGCKHREPMV